MKQEQEQETSTRRTMLTLLKTKGKMSVGELAKLLGITEMAVRRHLNTMERDGLVETKLLRQAMGRPTQLYSLTALSDDLFPKNYHALTLDLLDELAAGEGPEKVGELFERRKQKLYARYLAQMEGKPLQERVAALAEIQNANGYMADWTATGDGTYELKEFNCPIFQVANRYNDACACELALFESLLGAGVERTECLAKGGGKCTYSITSKEKSG